MNKTRLFLLSAFVLLMTTSVFAQTGNVAGIVLFAGGTPAGQVNVTMELERHHVDSLFFETITDDSGAFTFNNIPVDPYQIEAILEGYYPARAMVMVNPAHTSNVLLVLVPITTGSIAGTVTAQNSLGASYPAAGAQVLLAGHLRGPGHSDGDSGFGNPEMHLETVTDGTGAFSFTGIPTGTYTIIARLSMAGYAAEVIEVFENLTTQVALELEEIDHHGRPGGHDGHGEHQGDSLTTVQLSGVAMVDVVEDSLFTRTFYYLDVDDDDTADYRLNFGPYWYDPQNGNLRPQDGDEITVVGGLMGYAEPPLVIVWEMNGDFWREPYSGHGGHGGGWHHNNNCGVEPTGIEIFGIAQVRVIAEDAPHGGHTVYAIDTDNDTLPNYKLDFGAPDYDPENGATRPLDGAEITIVGGLIDCPNSIIDYVIVYEINGLFWRVPGDTLGLGAITTVDAEETPFVALAQNYTAARNYPNPFNPVTTIEFTIPAAGMVKLTVYDITGREVESLLSRNMDAGIHSVDWNGAAAPSGIYFYRLSYGTQQITQRMLLVK